MAQYQEAFTGKLDWAMPFQRSGGFPLDRSSMFESYADALAYARQDLTDKRKLGATSYVGQLVVVYGNDAGIEQQDGTIKYTQEVAGYIITAVGQSASLMKLAQTTSTGDFGKDITALNTAVGALDTRIKALEDKPDVVDTNTKYTFAPAATTEGAILVTNLDDNTTQEVQVKGWATLKALATGRTQAFVYQNKDDSTYITDISTKNKYKKGDVIYFLDKNIPDEWVTGTVDALTDGSYYTFSELEVEHPDLTQYLTITTASQTYATKTEMNAKAAQSDLTALQTTVSQNKTASDTAFEGVNTAIQGLQDKIDNIDNLLNEFCTISVDKLSDSNMSDLDYLFDAIKNSSSITIILEVIALIQFLNFMIFGTNWINSRKREINVRMLNGATYPKIRRLFQIQLFFITYITYFISFGIYSIISGIVEKNFNNTGVILIIGVGYITLCLLLMEIEIGIKFMFMRRKGLRK